MARKLEKSEWSSFLNRISKGLEPTQAEIEIASLNLGDQIQANWVPLIGIVYDAKDDIVEVAVEGLDHIIHRPRELYVEEEESELSEPLSHRRRWRSTHHQSQASGCASIRSILAGEHAGMSPQRSDRVASPCDGSQIWQRRHHFSRAGAKSMKNAVAVMDAACRRD